MSTKAYVRPGMRAAGGRFAREGVSAIALSLGLGLLFGPMAAAQETVAAEEDEVIVVQGIRASQQRALDLKRNSDAFVDVLSAEGIGDFPDTNLAEALQRVAGVSIDRSNGEGEFVSIRGLGPEFNTVLLNGRQLPTTNDGRQFSFDTIASELISRVNVFKTSPVQLQAGGIGATLNVFTPRPLDNPGFRAAFSGDALFEEASGAVTPRLFASISNTFFNDKVGVFLSGNFQRRDTEISVVESRGFNILSVGGVDANGNVIDADVDQSQFLGTVPEIGSVVFSPQNYDQFVNFEERERIGVNGAIQFRPLPNLTFTVDGLYSEFTVESNVESLGNWFGTLESLEDIVIDENNTVTELTRNDIGQLDVIQRSFNRPDEIFSFGFNTEWNVTPNFTAQYDVAYSEASSNNGGADRFVVAGFDQTVRYVNPGGGQVATISGIPADLATNFAPLRAHIAIEEGFGNSDSFSDDIFETRLDLTWKPDGVPLLDYVKGGALYSTREKANTDIQTDPGVLCLYCGYFLDVPDSLFSTFSVGSFLPSRGGDSGGLPLAFPVFDPDALIAFLELPSSAAARDQILEEAPGTTQAILDANDGFTAAVQPASFQIEEDIFEAYIDFGFAGELFGRSWRASGGFRFVQTDVTATGEQQVLVDLQDNPLDPTLFIGVFEDAGAVTVIENDYTAFLPNITLRYEPFENLVARFAYSRTLTRPSPVDLAPRVNFTVLRPDGLLATGGNPFLEPFTSDNLDVSLEWYFAPGSALTAAYFRKDTQGFIVSGSTNQTFPIESNPAGATFFVAQPVNGGSAIIDGVELGLLWNLDFLPIRGFGVQANATLVGASANFDLESFLATGEAFGIEGISNSQNVVGFFDNYGVEFRIAWNRRAGFLSELSNPVGGLPIFTAPFDQFDARLSYQINKQTQVYFEAINFTNEIVERTGPFDNQLLNLIDSGPRFSFGVRLSLGG